MQKSRVNVSLVIPAYNEESHLAACLEAVARQTVKPFEVIVVDNNSTDATATIARRFPFVRVVRETRQGVMYARDAGFDAARGDVIGRIDVDTHMRPDWVAQVQRIFAGADVDAVSGSIGFYDVPFNKLFGRLDSLFRRYLAFTLARRNELFLYGGNMAITKDAWQAVRGQVCHNRDFHEDIDLAAHFAHSDFRLAYDRALRVNVSARRVDSAFGSYYPYVVDNSRTYAAHGLRGRLYMYPVEILVVIFYPVLRMLYRSFDPETRKFSLKRMINPPYRARVSPVGETV
jgi:glycosyltransferase involved in cell wall biosynthesis